MKNLFRNIKLLSDKIANFCLRYGIFCSPVVYLYLHNEENKEAEEQRKYWEDYWESRK